MYTHVTGMEGRLSCSGLSARYGRNEIDSLSDKILVKILEKSCTKGVHYRFRAILPSVCKRWRDAIYRAKGSDFYRYVYINFDQECAFAKPLDCPFEAAESFFPSMAAVARWADKHTKRGNILFPCELVLVLPQTDEYARGEEDLAILLTVIGERLHYLQVHACPAKWRPGSQLCRLDFSNLRTVSNLRQLYLSDVQHIFDEEDVERGLTCLRHLERFYISGGVGIYRTAGLTAFPRALCSMQHLKSLEFRRQYFGHLPQEISKLTQLAHLSIADGRIHYAEKDHLPSVLSYLRSLESLHIKRCLRKDPTGTGPVPDVSQWTCMTQLTQLGLTGDCCGQKGQLPPEVSRLSSLMQKWLWAMAELRANICLNSSVDIGDITQPMISLSHLAVGSLIGLVQLQLEHFVELEDQPQLTTLKSLEVIEFWTSFLKRLPAWMGALPKLSTLRLNKVELQEWSFPGFKTLQALDLSRCNVTKVTDSIGQLTSLTSLIVEECPIEELSVSISRLQSLRQLQMEGSFFPEFPRALHALRAPQLQIVSLVAHWRGPDRLPARRAVHGKRYCAMPVAAEDLTWLLHHPRLEEVTITATQAEATALEGFREDLTKVCGRDILSIELCG